jgi:hypothetical protein
MHLGKSAPKLSLSCSFQRSRLRLGVAHHGVASSWTPPVKDAPAPRPKDRNGKRR